MKTQKLTGAEIVVRELIAQGVDTVFGYPGGQVLELYDALERKRRSIKHIITAHEQGAAHAADGYARASGKVGVVIATSGPGAANLVTGIATAYLDSVPMVAITGNVETAQIGRDSFQELDIADITMPITKHNYIVKDVTKLQATIREAFAIASTGRRGPVLIDIPKDVQAAKCEYFAELDEPKIKKMPTFDENELERAVSIIENSARPFIYCGGGAVSAGVGALVKELARRLDCPVGCSLMGLSALPDSSEYKLGLTGLHGLERACEAFAKSDVIIAVGARFTDRAIGARGERVGQASIVQLDIDPAEIDKNVTDSASLVGALADSLTALTARLSARQGTEWLAESMSRPRPDSGEGFTPYAIIDRVSAKLGDRIVITDVGQHQMWAAQRAKIERERGFITSGGLGTMGFGMGAAIGASIAGDGAPVLLYTGDGSFAMNLNELATAVSEAIPICIILMNNRALGMVRQWQELIYHRTSKSLLDRATDFVKVAEAFGAEGVRVSTLAELDAALGRVGKRPILIECTIDRNETVALTSQINRR